MSLKIYHVTNETNPFTGKTIVGDFIQNYSIIYNENKVDIRLFIPKYGYISDRKNVLREVIRLQDIPVNYLNGEIHSSVKSSFIPDSRVQTYFLEQPEMFDKIDQKSVLKHVLPKSLRNKYLDSFMYFSVASLNTLKYLYWKPDRIISNNWYSAIIPILLKNNHYDNAWFKGTKTILLLSSDQPFYSFSKEILKSFKIPECKFDISDPIEYLKAAIYYSDGVTFLKVKGKNYLQELLEDKDISKLIKGMGDSYKEINLESIEEKEFLLKTAKEYYTYLEKI